MGSSFATMTMDDPVEPTTGYRLPATGYRLARLDPIHLWSIACSVITAGALLALFLFLAIGSIPVLQKEGWSFFAENFWSYRKGSFGAAGMLYGTAVVSMVALLVAGPLGVGAALFMSEVCRPRFRLPVKLLVELLAGIPSVVYGLLGVLLLREWMGSLFEVLQLDSPSGDTLLTAGLLLAVMVLPTVATLTDDALQSIPAKFRDAARGLGLTRAESTMTVIIPQAFPGIVGALLLALGRALGETIAVFLVVGRADNRLPDSLFSLQPWIDAGQTITSKLGGAETNISVGDSLHTSAILALGFTLFVVVLGMTVGADLLRSRLGRRA